MKSSAGPLSSVLERGLEHLEGRAESGRWCVDRTEHDVAAAVEDETSKNFMACTCSSEACARIQAENPGNPAALKWAAICR